jgi:hypothetical protein
MNKEEWHEYFIKNKDNFTDSQIEAIKDTNKIWIEKQQGYAIESGRDESAIEDIEEGNWGTLYRNE